MKGRSKLLSFGPKTASRLRGRFVFVNGWLKSEQELTALVSWPSHRPSPPVMAIPDLHVVVSFYDRGGDGKFFSHRSSDIFLSGATRRRFVHCGEERGCFPGNQHYKLYHSLTYCAMHAYSDSPHSSGAFSPLEPVSKAPDGFYRDLYAVRSFGSLRRQANAHTPDTCLHTCRQQVMPNSMDILPNWQHVKVGQIVRQIHCAEIHCAEDGFQGWDFGHWLSYSPVVSSLFFGRL